MCREWTRLTHVFYQGHLVYQHPTTGELAWESRDHLVDLPHHIEQAIRQGRQGDLL